MLTRSGNPEEEQVLILTMCTNLSVQEANQAFFMERSASPVDLSKVSSGQSVVLRCLERSHLRIAEPLEKSSEPRFALSYSLR
jgi:hypothetical protein